MTILGLEIFLVLAGLGLGAMAVRVAMDRSHPRRAAAALFWGLLAICFAGGKHLPPAAVGLMVVVMAVMMAMATVQAATVQAAVRADQSAGLRIPTRSLGPRDSAWSTL